jgi:nucleotide-binding universal stress UspA family protein
MFERILAPSDASKESELVLPYLEELGIRIGSEITLVHVYPPKMNDFSEDMMQYMENVVQGLQSRVGNTSKVNYVILNGRPSDTIIYHAMEESYNVIVMATHGESGVRHWGIGSTVDKVVRGTSKPVLLIRAKSARAMREGGLLDKIVVALDGSRIAEVTIPYIEELALSLQAAHRQEIVLIQVVSPTYRAATGGAFMRGSYTEVELERLKGKTADYLEKVATGMRSKGIEVHCEVLVGDEAEEIMRFSDEGDANLLAMATHGISGFNRQYLGKVAERIEHHGQKPLLLVKPA